MTSNSWVEFYEWFQAIKKLVAYAEGTEVYTNAEILSAIHKANLYRTAIPDNFDAVVLFSHLQERRKNSLNKIKTI